MAADIQVPRGADTSAQIEGRCHHARDGGRPLPIRHSPRPMARLERENKASRAGARIRAHPPRRHMDLVPLEARPLRVLVSSPHLVDLAANRRSGQELSCDAVVLEKKTVIQAATQEFCSASRGNRKCRWPSRSAAGPGDSIPPLRAWAAIASTRRSNWRGGNLRKCFPVPDRPDLDGFADPAPLRSCSGPGKRRVPCCIASGCRVQTEVRRSSPGQAL